MLKRIEITDPAKEMLVLLKNTFGDLLFYQAGGCCEGTQPQCLEKELFFYELPMFALVRWKVLIFGSIKTCSTTGNTLILRSILQKVLELADFLWKHLTAKLS